MAAVDLSESLHSCLMQTLHLVTLNLLQLWGEWPKLSLGQAHEVSNLSKLLLLSVSQVLLLLQRSDLVLCLTQ